MDACATPSKPVTAHVGFANEAETVEDQPVPIAPLLKLLLKGVVTIFPVAVNATDCPGQTLLLLAVKLILHPGLPNVLYVFIVAENPGAVVA